MMRAVISDRLFGFLLIGCLVLSGAQMVMDPSLKSFQPVLAWATALFCWSEWKYAIEVLNAIIGALGDDGKIKSVRITEVHGDDDETV